MLSGSETVWFSVIASSSNVVQYRLVTSPLSLSLSIQWWCLAVNMMTMPSTSDDDAINEISPVILC